MLVGNIVLTAERKWIRIEIYLIGGKQMKTTEVIKQLLLQINTDDPKNEALITAIVTILNKCEAKTEEPKKRGRPAGSKKPFDIGKA